MRAPQVNLRQEITRNDAFAIMDWMKNHEVTQFMNETHNISAEISHAIERVNMLVMTHLFNRDGSFYIICTSENHPLGFLKLVHKTDQAEMVIVIGDNRKWGLGIGTQAINQGLNQAFFKWRTTRVIAKIDPRNTRSIRAFEKAGFHLECKLNHTDLYSINVNDYIKNIL